MIQQTSTELARTDPHATLALVIFDCDGVLVDSEPISLARLTFGLNRIGVPIDVDTVRVRFAGTSMVSIMAHIVRDYPVTVPDDFVDVVKADTLRAFDEGLTAMPGVALAISGLSLPHCVASSSDPVRLSHTLGLTGLLPLFGDRVYSSTMVARGKPAPDLFLHAAAAMGIRPGACLVVEDSVPGVQAARAAGMRVVGFVGGGHWAHDRTGADLIAAGAARVFTDFSAFAEVVATA
ncbi:MULTISPECIES: HAD family hydrolase [unclassified Methylobacterium]|uniref:HAD family hydrolase n=1 Tax=unclassified Methylobacterium TaxID=2615210 RepID=UPI000B262E30|nr:MULTISPECIES: HAD family hydrolase [unclassified Methylobacterium]USU33107.1 HAD family hydrolase [Methylobacterium sp. OTU13CASTA1]